MSEISSGECLNCRATLAGPYCAACGQKAVKPNPTFHDLVHEYTHELLHVDGRLWRSIGLLLSRPGFLTREHCTGRRARYLAPLRLYLIFSVLAFATDGMDRSQDNRPTVERSARQSETIGNATGGTSGPLLKARTGEQVVDRVRQVFHDWLPRMMLLMLPVWALLVMMVTRSARRTFPEHLYFSLHANAATFAALTVDHLLDALPWLWLGKAGTYIALAYAFWYAMTGIHYLYGGSWVRAFFRALTVGALYLTCLLAGIVTMLSLALLI